MDRSGNKDVSAASQDASREEPEMAKERETKEDGRYIIFYSFGDEEARGDD